MAGPNQVELTAARRAMDTLREKVVELGRQIENGAPVVDNEAKLEEIRDVEMCIRDSNYSVDTVFDGQAALDYALTDNYDCLLYTSPFPPSVRRR